ncbi:hypothetical protein JJD26997_1373 [Campylobacter jejuni subsp. doylei 269.97]|uniref:Uncharacterized protein n=1 Tax=Campylobacter jejuni subsp. doylei (strain ATCC BAA-1458 / RM4099 / 269.97) TaxID=360109 RepID=A7H4I5_CAMJD|nr:hypothetical protein JJD26997_1373 [Campylobacter jejuni subsp. doylei 269.97]
MLVEIPTSPPKPNFPCKFRIFNPLFTKNLINYTKKFRIER